MDFGLSEEQRMLQESMSRFLTEACPLDRVRECAEDLHRAKDLSAGLAELGVAQLVVPEQYGGLGLGLLDAALVQETLGQHVAPVPFSARAVLSVLALRYGGNAEQNALWLPQIASGEMRVGLAINERSGAREGSGVEVSEGKAHGKLLFAWELTDATHLLLADNTGGLHLAELANPGVQTRTLTTIDKTRSADEVVLGGCAVQSLRGENQAGEVAARLTDAARILLAADSLGAAQTMIGKAVAYAGERQQFNRLIGSFQAVKHLCAEMAARLEPCRALIWYAAYAHDQKLDDARLMSLLAKSHISEVGQFVARTATEVHGGMGFTDLLGLHYWFKRIGANRQLLGGPERLRAEAATLQGWA
tara:strand:- start:258 stop:1343 length:1086 start_codon:yes stop_codon:yes gene_type:complete